MQDHFLWLRFQCVNVLWGEGLLPELFAGVMEKVGNNMQQVEDFLKDQKKLYCSFIMECNGDKLRSYTPFPKTLWRDSIYLFIFKKRL